MAAKAGRLPGPRGEKAHGEKCPLYGTRSEAARNRTGRAIVHIAPPDRRAKPAPTRLLRLRLMTVRDHFAEVALLRGWWRRDEHGRSRERRRPVAQGTTSSLEVSTLATRFRTFPCTEDTRWAARGQWLGSSMLGASAQIRPVPVKPDLAQTAKR